MFSGTVDLHSVLGKHCFLQKTSALLQVEGKMATGNHGMALETGDLGVSMIEEKEDMAEEFGMEVNSERELNMANESGNTDIETGVNLGQEQDQVAAATTSSVDSRRTCRYSIDRVKSYFARDNPTLPEMSSKITDKSVTIHRVPKAMLQRGESESLYKPTRIDVYNPVLNGNDKCYYFHLKSIDKKNENKCLDDYLQMMEEQKEEIAKRYEEHISTDSALLLGLLLSSCFILDLFLRFFCGELPPADDPECGHRWVHDLWVDLLLVENQIPFFILEKVYEMACPDKDRTPLEILAFVFFQQFVPMNWEKLEGQFGPTNKGDIIDRPIKVNHLLHFVHDNLMPSDPGRYKRLKRMNRIPDSLWGTLFNWLGRRMRLTRNYEWLDYLPEMRTIRTATRLQQAGVKFRPRAYSGFVVKFNNGVLELPHLHVGKTTKKFLRNLIAWEQCHRKAEKYFTTYTIFMDYLVNTSKDIEILMESRVLEHSLKNNKEVAQVFNILSHKLDYTKLESYDFLPKLRKELNRYCDSKFNKSRANVMTDYFGSPWKTISVIAAALIVLLTMLQSFFSVYAYFRPPPQPK